MAKKKTRKRTPVKAKSATAKTGKRAKVSKPKTKKKVTKSKKTDSKPTINTKERKKMSEVALMLPPSRRRCSFRRTIETASPPGYRCT